MTVYQLPAIALAAEEFGYAQIEKNGLWPAAQAGRGTGKPTQ
jgi:hypothetical protein